MHNDGGGCIKKSVSTCLVKHSWVKSEDYISKLFITSGKAQKSWVFPRKKLTTKGTVQ